MKEKKVILKPGKDKAIRNRHHWIFSGAIQDLPDISDGSFAAVYNNENYFLGSAYFNRQSKIIGRMVSFDETPPLEAIQHHLNEAIDLRTTLFSKEDTNAYRLVNGEGDLLPGLIVDKYHDVLVVQISTLGMDKLRTWLIDYLAEKLYPKCIYEKSQLPSRKEEGLSDLSGLLFGNKLPQEVEIRENGLRFLVSIAEGQKTGFFFDHREMRKLIRQLAHNRSVLNCFAYTGGFSVYAMAGGAKQVDSVDISKTALEIAQKNALLNQQEMNCQRFILQDVFPFLRERDLNYDLIILDPPAFAKKQKDVISACRGYKEINRIAIQKMPSRSLLLTCSCSYYVDAELFQKIIFQSSVEAGRTVRILGRHHLAPDHPVNICHPESDYLKSLLLYIE